jgi:hypothetical protein
LALGTVLGNRVQVAISTIFSHAVKAAVGAIFSDGLAVTRTLRAGNAIQWVVGLGACEGTAAGHKGECHTECKSAFHDLRTSWRLTVFRNANATRLSGIRNFITAMVRIIEIDATSDNFFFLDIGFLS